MMTPRENLLSLLRRQGYEWVPYQFTPCPEIVGKFHAKYGADKEMWQVLTPCWRQVDMPCKITPQEEYRRYYPQWTEGTFIDGLGVGHRPGSEAAKHMTYMLHPLERAESVEEIEEYPLPIYSTDYSETARQVEAAHREGMACFADAPCTIWENAWYIRGMENLMMDMMCEDEMATVLLDRILEMELVRVTGLAKAGVDIIGLGDDIGTQKSIMMSEELYRTWLKPRLKKVIDAIKAANPETLVSYHSCGYIVPFIEDLIEVGVDILNPVQPECMDFKEIHDRYGDRLSFWGTIGTQSTMPFGTPEDVKKEVWKNLDIAGEKGGLLVAPTHLLEPEVPWENIEAYMEACKTYQKR